MSGKKKHKKDKHGKKKHKKQQDLSGAKVMGSDISTLGTALVGAAVGELAHSAIARFTHSADDTPASQPEMPDTAMVSSEETMQSAAIPDSRNFDAAVRTLAQTLSDGDNLPPVMHGLVDTAKGVVEDMRPAVGTVMESVKDRAGGLKDSIAEVASTAVLTAQKEVKKARGKKKGKKSK